MFFAVEGIHSESLRGEVHEREDGVGDEEGEDDEKGG